jgi:23S rRNA pseudouridine1911/1915/1917 synthase
MGPPWMEHVVEGAEAGRTVGDILRGPLGLSGRAIQRLTRGRGIRVNRRAAWLEAKVRAGDVVTARVESRSGAGLEPVAMELSIAYEDDQVLVIDKPPFLLVHPTSPSHDRTLAHGVAAHLRSRGGQAAVHPVHRIDRDTSGLVLFARSPHAHHLLDRELREGGFEREYLALVEGTVEGDEGTIAAPVARAHGNPTLREVRADGDPAVTRWRVEERLPTATLLRCRLETGRTHQIRVHLAHLGHPVIGDRPYGARPTPLLRRHALHAARLAFPHPSTGERVSLEAPLPPDLLEAVRLLREGAGG